LFKDPNEALQDDDLKSHLISSWYAAKKFRPKGIVGDYSEIEAILRQESQAAIGSYPFGTLQQMSYGIRPGELVLFTAQEKVGKTEVLRAIEHHLLKTTTENIGIIHLEEEEKRSVQGLIGYELSRPCHLPDCGLSVEDQMESYQRLTGSSENRVQFYSHFGTDDPDIILDNIRYLVTGGGCKFVFLDHITMLVTGFAESEQDERKTLDRISTRLAMMTRELDFTLFLVSHVNDDGKTRGSRNIAKVADLIVHLERDLEASDAETRNTTELLVRGNRFAGVTGPAGKLVFNPSTFKLSEKEILIADRPIELDLARAA